MQFPQQLSLGVGLNDDATFDNFYCAPDALQHALIINELQRLVAGEGIERFVYLWGAPGAGVSHLLQAVCLAAQRSHLAFQYLPLRDLREASAEAIFCDLELLDMVCIDDLDVIVGREDWELALFAFFNAARDRNKRLLIGARRNPRELPLVFPDLRSRLQWGSTYQVSQLKDADKQAALQLRARRRGLELNDEVGQFLIQRLPRDTNVLFSALSRLDHASLAQQRKLTIPFVKKILDL